MKTARLSILLILLTALCATIQAQNSRRRSGTTPGTFSYYLLVLSWAPDFCAEPGGNKTPAECGAGRNVGFVVHGLWPQADAGRGPENCGPASPVSQATVSATLPYIPTAGLIQHEWSAHGTCSGLASADYFALLRKARDSVTIPPQLDKPTQSAQLTPVAIASAMASSNGALPAEAFRVSCYNDAKLQEVRICLNKDLSGRACPASAGQCGAPSITVLPVH